MKLLIIVALISLAFVPNASCSEVSSVTAEQDQTSSLIRRGAAASDTVEQPPAADFVDDRNLESIGCWGALGISTDGENTCSTRHERSEEHASDELEHGGCDLVRTFEGMCAAMVWSSEGTDAWGWYTSESLLRAKRRAKKICRRYAGHDGGCDQIQFICSKCIKKQEEGGDGDEVVSR